jgi:hypothetical protein
MKVRIFLKEGKPVKTIRMSEKVWKRVGALDIEKELGKRFGYTRPKFKYKPNQIGFWRI